MRFAERRNQFLDLLLAEEKDVHTFDWRGAKVKLRVCAADSEGGATQWRYAEHGDPNYDWRCVLRSQVVFDIGDDIEVAPGVMEARPWSETRDDTHRIWDALNDFLPGTGGEYWGSLSAGKGTHTEVFLRPYTGDQGRDFREAFAAAVLTMANERIPIEQRIEQMLRALDPDKPGAYGVIVDPGLLAPKGDHLIREFGSRKTQSSKWQKTLWTVGPGSYKPLPDTREEAYAQAGPLRIPDSIKPAVQPPGVFHAMLSEALGVVCPRGPQCLPPNCGWDGTCDSCPATS